MSEEKKFICNRCSWRGFNNGQCLECDGVSEEDVSGMIGVNDDKDEPDLILYTPQEEAKELHDGTSDCFSCVANGNQDIESTRLITRFIKYLQG